MNTFYYHIKLVIFIIMIILFLALSGNAQIPSNVDTLHLGNGSGHPGEVIIVGVYLVNTFAVGGFSTRLVFDESVFSISTVRLADRTSDMNIFAIDTSDTGVIHVSGAYFQPREDFLPPGSGEIFQIDFQIDEYADSGTYPLDFEDSGYQTYENHLSDTTGLQMVLPILSNGEIEIDAPVSVDRDAQVPAEFSCIYNYPNPFNNRTSFQLILDSEGSVTFDIFNMIGQKIRSFDMGVLTPGEYKFDWDGRNEYGKEVASGVYSYALFIDDMSVETKKMILLK